LVLVDDFLVRNAIDHAGGFAEEFLRSGFVSRGNRLLHLLDRGAEFGAQRSVVLTLLLGLARPLARLCGVSHEKRNRFGKAGHFSGERGGAQGRSLPRIIARLPLRSSAGGRAAL